MDCVGCDKCRLWGKVQTSGLGTALKILFELDEKALEQVHCVLSSLQFAHTCFVAHDTTPIYYPARKSSHSSTPYIDFPKVYTT